jgi:two-component system CheB/CheR fusion protein
MPPKRRTQPRRSPRSRGGKSRPATRAADTIAPSDVEKPAAQPVPIASSDAVVVGIGASAGGLEALKAFLGAVPPDSGLIIVVVMHLNPTHESLLTELLARATKLQVQPARDRQVTERGHVYVIPPNRHLTIEQGLIRLREPVDRRGLRGTIDHFFRSLAEDLRERAVCIVMSGTGTEGTLGARAVKAEGGMVMAQAPETAVQSGMPTSAIATGLVDFILPPEQMPKALLGYVRHSYLGTAASSIDEAKPQDGLRSIVTLLRGRAKHDFRGYKKGTLQRRIARRMGLRQITSFQQYLELLQNEPAEVDLLYKDLLISVSGFFRDPPAWDELSARVLSKLIVEDGWEEPVRIWVPGCATGEEAYSLAILASELSATVQSPRRFQIFATDADERALEVARAGVYPDNIALDVSAQRLQRFFTGEDHHYRVSKLIRESVVFASQNLISDPPFSKLDLVSCRNVLIYLEPDVQRKLLVLFHFALNHGGHLFLGTAEGAGDDADLFVPVSKRWRIYAKVSATRRPSMSIPFPKGDVARAAAIKTGPEPALSALAEQQLLAYFEPAAVVVNRGGEIRHFSGPMHRYLNLPVGAPTLDLASLARDPLKPILRAALHDGIRRRRRASFETAFGGSRRSAGTLRITVSPVSGTREQEGLSLVIFEEVPSQKKGGARAASQQQRDVVRRLEEELKLTRHEREDLIEQLEGSNQELKAANEEMTSMNEELQSTNEELESSKEELQSMNEELSTLNSQLQEKVQELTATNDDLTNLLAATDIATVFIDGELRVTRFTAAATRLLHLIPSDLGRPIAHLATNLVEFEVALEVEKVLRSGTPTELSVRARDGRHYIVRVLPYVREGRMPQGVVVTLTDVSALKNSEQELLQLNQTLEQRIADRTRYLSLLHDVARTVNEASSWDEALHGALRHICTAGSWQIGYVYLPTEAESRDLAPVVEYLEGRHFMAFHDPTAARVTAGEGIAGRAYSQGQAVWAEDQEALIRLLPSRAKTVTQLGLRVGAALPLSVGGRTVAVLELFSNVPHRMGADELTQDLLTDLGAQIGAVIDRERTMSQAAALVWRDQQGLVHALHDSLGQELTGIGMLSNGLSKKIGDRDGEVAEIVRRISVQAQASIEQVRHLSRGLFPVEVDADGLVHALQRLADTTSKLGDVRCILQVAGLVLVRDNRIATELFRIAQEAVTNALKHANPSRIGIALSAEPGVTILKVENDGCGVDTEPSNEEGMGLRIMRYRAQSIGAIFTFESTLDAGTVVTCQLRDPPVR